MAPDTELSDRWNLKSSGQTDYHLSVFGPNGFLRIFKGSTASGRANLATSLTYDIQGNGVVLGIRNHSKTESEVNVSDCYAHQTVKLRLEPDAERSEFWSLDRSYGWYDLTVTSGLDSSFEHRLAGHLETGRDSMSDPAIGTVQQSEQANLNQRTTSPVDV